MHDFGYATFFQIVNTLLILGIFIGIPLYLVSGYKSSKAIEKKLDLIVERLIQIDEKLEVKDEK